MAILKDTLVNGNLEASSQIITNKLMLNGQPVYLLSGTIAANETANKLVTASQVKTYIESKKGSGTATISPSQSVNFTPTIIKHTKTNIVAKDITVEQPSSGYYIAVQSASQAAKAITASATISTAGWFPKNYQFNSSSINAGLSASATYYIPIATAVRTGSSNPLAAGQSCSISAGYLPNKIDISTKSLAEQTSATLNTGGSAIGKTYFMAKDQTAWKDGVKYTGEAEVYYNTGLSTISVQDDVINFPWGLYYNGFTVKAHFPDASFVADGANIKVTTAGYASAGKVVGNIPAAVIHNGYVTDSGYIAKSSQVYKLQYNSTHECVDFIFD